jgi:proton-translocating NADH-quinone oxidoreductase chain L
MSLLLEATYTLNSVFPEASHGFPWQCLLGLLCFLFPVAGFFLQVLFGKHLPRQGDWLPVGAMFLSFLCAVGICAIHLSNYDPNYAVEWRWNWMSIEGDGKGVKHTPENLAKLHLGDALIELSLLDATGKPSDGVKHIDELKAKLEGAKTEKVKFETSLEKARKDVAAAGDDKAKLALAKAAVARNSDWLAQSEAEIAKLTSFIERDTELAARFKTLREKTDLYFNTDIVAAYELDEATVRSHAYELDPSAGRNRLLLSWLHDSDGTKRAENHARFATWLNGASEDAKFTRDLLRQYTRENAAAAYVNQGDTLKNAFTIGIYIDNTTAITIFMVTLLSFLIHLFSTGYMKGEVRYARFFATINLFTVGMIGLVLANNFLWLFVCWEIMGLCSYLLIGHYYEKESAQAACIKAFLTTRIGDCFMFVGMMIIFINSHTLLFSGPTEFQAMFAGWQEGVHGGGLWGLTTYAGPGSMFAMMGAKAALIGGFALSIMGVLLFIGPVGKSAQFPLHVWLPDAMEGPTPVSAMIHAACMVSAGVYLTARLFPLFTPDCLHVIALVGGFTALFAGTIGLMQTDIKKVLAYSTISQLGYMFLGIGVGAWTPAVFHMITHAFFKALMFLGSGSVILGCSHEQEMTRMGGLWKKMPITAATFWIGNLAITGAPFFFSGFYSKEAVLTQAQLFGKDGEWWVLWLPYIFGALGAGLTTFYMFRLVWMTFHGKPRDQWVYDHAKESPWNVVLPLIIIAGFATVVGWPLAAHTNTAENLGFTNVVEFGVLTWLTIVLGLMGGLYLFRRRDGSGSGMMRAGAWTLAAGMPALLLFAIGFGYLGWSPRTTDAGPHGEAEAEYNDEKNLKDLIGLRQHDRSQALVEANEKELLAEIKKRAEKKQAALSDSELRKVVDEFGTKLAQAIKSQADPKVVGRPSAEGLGWFGYLVQKPKSAYSHEFLVNEARFRENVVDSLYIGNDGYVLTSDAPGMMPSATWGGRYHDWREREGLPADPRFPLSEKQARDDLAERESKRLEDKIAKANEYDKDAHAEHGEHAEHEAHDPITHEWHEKHHTAHLQVFGGSMVAFLIGLALSMFFFSPWGPFYRREWVGHVGPRAFVRTLLKRGYYMDEFYYNYSVLPVQGWLMRACAWFDKVIIDGIVNAVGAVTVWLGFAVAKADYWGVDGAVRFTSAATGWAGSTASKAPTGKISDYVFMLIGAIVLLFILLALLS